ncbi:hypothetical protein [Novosphingobium sp. B 225]|uniref:hypothetical protein n=1 Tax=Novosphingobium sp. B 225 TaxID=1961849 RepID=UPI0011251616|nr:hypothetical protein [Novosphingobium sp. B 225]
MANPAPPHPALALLKRETRLCEGAVPLGLDGGEIRPDSWQLDGERFLFRSATGLGYLYVRGEGIIAQRPPGWDPDEDSLIRNGSVYAAVACINGLYPIHASAVAWQGRVHAFTGPSGAGKSTLTAELTRRGLPLFCDDTLLLDLTRPEAPLCLPGHKRLKLWPDALALTGASPTGKIAQRFDKFYAEPAGGSIKDVLPLASLTFLEEGEHARIEPLHGAEKLLRLQDDHYTTDLFLAASQPDRAGRFAQLAALARGLSLSRFIRPRDTARFAVDAGVAERHVKQHPTVQPDSEPGP